MASGVFGVNQLGEVARRARLAGDEYQPKIRKAIAKIGPPAKRAVQEQAEKKMPKANGYATLLARAIRLSVRTDLGYTTAGVTLVTYAPGKGQRRDIPALNQGILRHPVYGRRRRKWVSQRVPARFWDEAMDKTSDDAEKRVAEVLDETTQTLKGR